ALPQPWVANGCTHTFHQRAVRLEAQVGFPAMDTNESLQALLAQAAQQYASAQHAPPAPGLALDNALLTSPEFRMYCYKIVPCTRRYGHDWTACPFCHPGEKATRRCPQKCNYLPIACPDMKKAGECPRGEACLFAHNTFEVWLHPLRYRSQMCSYGPDCRRGICFFAHQPPELRVVDQSYLQEIERQLDAMGVSSAAFGFPPSNNAKVQHHQERGTPGGSSNTTGASSTAAGSERSERGTGTGSGDRGADRSSGQGASQPGSTHHTPRARVPMGTGLGTVGGLVGGAPDEVSTAALLVQLQLQRTTGEPVPKSLKTQSSSLQAHASPGPSTPGSAMPGDKSEQDKIMQAAALLGMDPMQLAHLKQLYGSKSAHQGMRGLSAQSSACVTPTAAGLGGGGHGGQGSQQALLQAAMQQMMAQASSATGMSAAPASPLNHLNHSQGMLLGTPGSTGHSQTLGYQLSGSREHGGRPGQGMGSNDSNDSTGNNNMNSDLSAGFAAGMMAALQGGAISARDSLPNPHQSPHHMQQQHSGFPAQQNSAAASSLLASSLSLRSPLPSLSANDETMAATLKLLADLTMGSRSNAASDTAATLHQQQQQAAASAMAAHFMSAAQQRDQQQSLQPSASYNHEGGAFSAAAAAAAAALMGHSFTGADGNSMALPNSHVHPGQVSAAPPSTSYPGHPSLSSLQLAGVLQQMSMQLMAQGNGAEGQAQAAALATMLPDLLRSLHDPRAPPLPSSPAP
ncbi:hypothetical protein QJQ45_016821, partial [Haematococcus lacustris]